MAQSWLGLQVNRPIGNPKKPGKPLTWQQPKLRKSAKQLWGVRRAGTSPAVAAHRAADSQGSRS
jgi:hypothetical protein